MSGLKIIPVAAWSGKRRANIIFVHGLGGHAYNTWRRRPGDDSFWPRWLAEDIKGVAVFTLSYEASPSTWLGHAMPLPDRTISVLQCIRGEPTLNEGPIAFICHSLGGLIIKQLLLDLDRKKMIRKVMDY